MSLFKKKRVLKAVAKGEVIPLTKVNDAVFSTYMMGTGFAIVEHSGQVFAPVSGEILSIFPTLHAITIESGKDTLLIHMGLDTVEMKGQPFSIFVNEGDQVECGQLLAEMDLQALAESQKDSVIIVVLPEISAGNIISENKQISIKDDVFKY